MANNNPTPRPPLRLALPPVTDEHPGEPPGDDDADYRPTIRIVASEWERQGNEGIGALAVACPDLYQRDGELVRLVRVADHEHQADHARQAPGTPQIRPLALATLGERLTSAARWLKRGQKADTWIEVGAPDKVVAAVGARAEYPGIRPIVGILEAPSLRPDGTLLQEPGYDAATGYVYAPSIEFPPAPETPTIDDARAAWASLREPWAEFPWCTELDLAAVIAALLTLIGRAAILGDVPAFTCDASSRGSGKTLTVDAVTCIAQGRPAAKMSWPKKSNEDDSELEKIIGAYALRGASVLPFDNVQGVFGGGAIERLITCGDRLALRELGKSRAPELSWKGMVIAGGNNIVIGDDMARRVIKARMEPTIERPEERGGYAHPDLLAWCKAERARLVVAALTVLRCYVVAGRPNVGINDMGFPAWARLIASAVFFVSGHDVNKCRPSLGDDDDPDMAALRTVVDNWNRLAPDGATAKRAIDALWSEDRVRGRACEPDGFDDLREAVLSVVPTRGGHKPDSVKFAGRLRSWRKKIVGDKRLDYAPTTDRSGSKIWRVT